MIGRSLLGWLGLLLVPLSQSFSTTRHSFHRFPSTVLSMQNPSADSDPPYAGIDISVDPRLYKVRLPRAPGIEWGTDLSFAFVYVRDLEVAGPADVSGQVQKGHHLCEITPVYPISSPTTHGIPIPLIGASFDTVMNTFATLDKNVVFIDFVFFQGTQAQLKALCNQSSSSSSQTLDDTRITIRVIQRNKATRQMETIQTISSTKGVNLRQVLVDHGINVYQSVTRWTNCKGKQLCGTCIVNVTEGGIQTNRKSMDEASTLRENLDSYRLSCVTFVYGDITVETFPPIQPTQWTR